jgi:threonine dehydrogenase-like Zn-dependent dehydrogenase
MKVARLYSFNDIRIEDIPIPEIGPGDALIKTKASGICSGDVMQWYIEKKAPLVLGHEPAGEIVELGSLLVTHHFQWAIGSPLTTMHPVSHAGIAGGVIMCSAKHGKIQRLFQEEYQSIS